MLTACRSHRGVGRQPVGATLALCLVLGLVVGVLPGVTAEAAAHEIPADVTVQMFVRHAGPTLRLLVRVPLVAMRDIAFPLRGPGYLDLRRADPTLSDAAELWIADDIDVLVGGRRIEDLEVAAVRVSLPSDRSFGSYGDALAKITGPPLPRDTLIRWDQALLDVLLEAPLPAGVGAAATAEPPELAIEPSLARLGMRTTTVLRFLPSDGPERVFQYVGDPGLVRLDPRWHQAAARFVVLGFEHILDGVDHLLFLLCLVVPIRRLRPLVAVVTSFTVAHSITLIASAFHLAPGALWFPPLIETLIAASIVYMALENIVGSRLRHRWLITFGFGLVHGFGFSFALRETLQFAGSHLLTSLLAFNVGVELGQLFVLALAVPALNLLFRHVVAERIGTILISALLAHQAWHWMTARGSDLFEYRFEWPALDLALLAGAMRWAMLALIVTGAIWSLFLLYDRFLERPAEEGAAVMAEE